MKKEKIIISLIILICIIGMFLITSLPNETEANDEPKRRIECVDTITLEKWDYYRTETAYTLPTIRRYLDTLPDRKCFWVVYYGWFKECFYPQGECVSGYDLATSEPLENESYRFKVQYECDGTIEVPLPELEPCVEVLK